MIIIKGHRVTSIQQANQLYIDDTITARQLKKIRNYFDAMRAAVAMRQHAVEVEDLESAWDAPGAEAAPRQEDPPVSAINTNDTQSVIPF